VRYRIEWTTPADRQLRKLDDQVGKRIAVAVSKLATDPRPAAATPLLGQPAATMRLRVGDYRVGYVIEDDTLIILVVRAGHRREAYRRL
jgi:mRNA interferase RelE/StbE